ncbi:MAG: hypothetical protein AB8B58_02640 [Roseobacter sp.]
MTLPDKMRACVLNKVDVNTRSGWYSKAVTQATTGNGFDRVEDEDLDATRIGVRVICGN